MEKLRACSSGFSRIVEFSSVKAAYQKAMLLLQASDFLVAFGSFALVNELAIRASSNGVAL